MLIRWGQISLLALLAVFTLFIAGDVRDAASQESDEPDADTGAATSLDDVIVAQGQVECADTIEIRCEVPGNSTIREIADDGTEVQAGDLIVQLDDAPLQAELAAHQIAVGQARAAVEQAQARLAMQNAATESQRELLALRLEIAELELKRYQDAELPLEIQRSDNRIQLAEEQISALSERVEHLEALEQAIGRSELRVVRVELTEARADLDLARQSRRMLTDFDGPLNTRKLELRVVEARLALKQMEQSSTASRTDAEAAVTAATVALENTEQRLPAIREAIEMCVIHAPRDGIVVHAVATSRRAVNSGFRAGAEVREGQRLIQMPDLSRLHVQLSVDEEEIARVRVGQLVTLFVGDSDERLRGTVTSVGDRQFNAYAPRSPLERVQFSVLAEFDEPPPGLRIGTRIGALIDVSGADEGDE